MNRSLNINCPQEVHTALLQQPLFMSWRDIHQQGYLSHFFCRVKISPTVQEKTIKKKGKIPIERSSWEIGFFDPQEKKITVFQQTNEGFVQQPADEVFQKEPDLIEELQLSETTVSCEEALQTVQKEVHTRFSSISADQGFIVLQKLNSRAVWNLNFTTKGYQVIHFLVDATSGSILESKLLEVIQRT